jgi:hypothetical protein
MINSMFVSMHGFHQKQPIATILALEILGCKHLLGQSVRTSTFAGKIRECELLCKATHTPVKNQAIEQQTNSKNMSGEEVYGCMRCNILGPKVRSHSSDLIQLPDFHETSI